MNFYKRSDAQLGQMLWQKTGKNQVSPLDLESVNQWPDDTVRSNCRNICLSRRRCWQSLLGGNEGLGRAEENVSQR